MLTNFSTVADCHHNEDNGDIYKELLKYRDQISYPA